MATVLVGLFRTIGPPTRITYFCCEIDYSLAKFVILCIQSIGVCTAIASVASYRASGHRSSIYSFCELLARSLTLGWMNCVIRYLYSNALSGSIPISWSSLSELSTLYTSYLRMACVFEFVLQGCWRKLSFWVDFTTVLQLETHQGAVNWFVHLDFYL